jgi:hypothetical protein
MAVDALLLAADLDVREREAAVRGLRPGVPGAGVPQCELRAPDAVPAADGAQRGVTTHLPTISVQSRCMYTPSSDVITSGD